VRVAHHHGCRLSYDLCGDDPSLPCLLLIRGFGRSSRYWGPLLPRLEPYLRLLLVDNRGAGRSGATRPPYTTRQLADDLAAVLDAAAIARAHVFGMSLGGMIAQELALAHPERVDRLVLGCTTPGGPRARRTPPRAQLAMLRAALGRPDALFALLLSHSTRRAHPDLLDRWRVLDRTERLPLRGVLGQAAAALRHDALARLSALRHPTLVLTGDDDEVVPPHNSRLLAGAIPGATLAILAGARHDFPADRPVETAHHLLRFLIPHAGDPELVA
jgi:pimeloyl-ACP methyl ester carboxylesterase